MIKPSGPSGRAPTTARVASVTAKIGLQQERQRLRSHYHRRETLGVFIPSEPLICVIIVGGASNNKKRLK
jgi:hypothetical protein